ncbi:PTS sugar transporter subunit IIA [Dolosicoccus paucivorans]|uniref:PTS sugar transporter subunit IIA n=1 Tax=Dolosicoccus paucivorans TaxID=84521 RepID=UPI00088B78FF|nr:PTS sugar transporter subunit IIA [Dolosicoccus paucivorans]SDI68201.1 PTS system, mannose-specific IIA component [Dolosicoccus paucivorans]
MFDIFVATHGTFADGLKDAVDVITGMADGIQTFKLGSSSIVEELGKDLEEKLKELNNEAGTIIFVDLLSASPYNQSLLAISQLPSEEQNNVHIIAGVNLPMVLDAINHRLLQTSVEEAVKLIQEQGRTGIGHWSAQLVNQSDVDDDGF